VFAMSSIFGVSLRSFRLSFVAVLSTLGMGVSVPASAQEGAILQEIFSVIGITDKGKEEIVYRERAPLVVPPKTDLRTPMQPEEVSTNPSWPVDPDVVARKKADNVARIPVTETERYKLEKNPRLSIDQIRAGRKVGAETSQAPFKHVGDNDNYELYYKPIAQGKAMASQYSKKEELSLTYGQEPERKYLTDPPKGLRLPASTAAIPKSVKQEAPEVNDVIDQQGFAARGY
jgi:hypothetical protein